MNAYLDTLDLVATHAAIVQEVKAVIKMATVPMDVTLDIGDWDVLRFVHVRVERVM